MILRALIRIKWLTDTLDNKVSAPDCSDVDLWPWRAVEASLPGDRVLRASTLNFERRGVLNERRDAKMVH